MNVILFICCSYCIFLLRWEALEEGVKAQQKLVDAQSLQWNTYQESLAQVLSWLDQMEKHLKHDSIFTLTSPNDIRSKLLRQKVNSPLNVLQNTLSKYSFFSLYL